MNMPNNQRRIYTVSRLNQEVQSALEGNFGTVWLQGELSNFSRPASGHFYFSLKDSRAQVRCAMFKGRNRYVDFKPENGDEVLVRGKLGLYAARGDFQLIVEHMEPAGAGKLAQQFEATRKKLNELGWFDQESKLSLPSMPQTIGVVTSPTGAAVQDVLQVLDRRYPQAQIIIYPTVVQGAASVPSIVKALNKAAHRKEVDVLLLVRGGGSLEDLWSFNDEQVAQAIKECPIPLVSGVGHEVDVTIADLVADVRAPTPSAAAELATPDGIALIQRAQMAETALFKSAHLFFRRTRDHLLSLEQRIQARHPQRIVEDRSQRVDELDTRLRQSMQRLLQQKMAQTNALEQRIALNSPSQKLRIMSEALNHVQMRLQSALNTRLTNATNRWQLAARALDTVSPLATLDRGFAVVKKGEQVVREASDLAIGDVIVTSLSKGSAESQVTRILNPKADDGVTQN